MEIVSIGTPAKTLSSVHDTVCQESPNCTAPSAGCTTGRGCHCCHRAPRGWWRLATGEAGALWQRRFGDAAATARRAAQAQRGVDVATVWVRQRHDVARPTVNGEAGVCQGHPPSRGKPLLLATTPKRCVTPLVSRCVFGEEISCR